MTSQYIIYRDRGKLQKKSAVLLAPFPSSSQAICFLPPASLSALESHIFIYQTPLFTVLIASFVLAAQRQPVIDSIEQPPTFIHATPAFASVSI